MTLRELLEQRSKIVAQMRAISAAPAGDGGDLSEDQARQFDAFKAELTKVEQRIERQSVLDDAERRMQGQPLTGGTDEFSRSVREFRLTRLIASTFDGNVDAGREREVCAEQRSRSGTSGEGFLLPFECVVPERQRIERRVLTVGGTAGNLVSETVLGNEFIDALRPLAVATRLGARTITGLRGDIALPKRTNRNPLPAWFQENAAITSGDQVFTQVAGSPKHLGVITVFSRKTMLQTSPEIETITREHLMQELALGLDLGVLDGSGASGQPTGIIQTAGINTFTGAATWDAVLAVIAEVEAANVAGPFGWAMPSTVKAIFRGTPKHATAAADFLMDTGNTIDGAPVGITNALTFVGSPPSGEAIFGAWSQVVVAMWSGVEILVNPFESTAYAAGNVSVRGILDADVLVRHPLAFNHWSSIT